MANLLTEAQLIEHLEAEEAVAAEAGRGVSGRLYNRLAKLYRKHRRYGDEVRILERYAKKEKQPGAVIHELKLRLEHAKALTNGSVHALNEKRARLRIVTLVTSLGKVTINNPLQHGAAVIAQSQSEDHIAWYFDVYRRGVLTRAVENLRAYQNGSERAKNWDNGYVDFMEGAPDALARLDDEKHQVLEENRRRIKGTTPTVVATYPTLEEAQTASEHYAEKFCPRLGYGWQYVRVIELPTE